MDADPSRDHPLRFPQKIRRGLYQIWTNEAIAASRDCPSPGRKPCVPGSPMSTFILRCVTEIPESQPSAREHGRRGRNGASLPRLLYPQYSRGNERNGERRSVRRACSHAMAAGDSDAPPLFRQSSLYRRALQPNLKRQLEALDFTPQRLLLSFHGMPNSNARSWRSLPLPLPQDGPALEELGRRSRRRLPVEIRARSNGSEPSTDATLAALSRAGRQGIAIAAPGFSVDCIETLEELGIRRRPLARGGDEICASRLPQ